MRVHTGDKPPKRETNYEKGYLLPSQVRTQPEKPRVPCEVCGKEFKDRWKVKRHMRVHTGEKPPPKRVVTHYAREGMATNDDEKTTGYAVFVQNCYAQHKRQNSDKVKDVEEFNKQCSVWWYNLSEQDRQKFHQTAQNINQQQANNAGMVQNATTSNQGEMATFTYDYGGIQGQVVNTVMDNNGQVINYSTTTGQIIPQGQAKPHAKKTTVHPDAPDSSNKKSGYYIFAQEETAKIRQHNPNLGLMDIAKELGVRWQRMDPTDKMVYEFRHQELRKQQGHHTPSYKPRQMSFKSHKKRRDPNAPKQPLTAFFIYSTEERQKVKEENPTFSVVDVAKELGRRWSELPPETKQSFHARADELRQKFDLEMAAYKQQTYQ